MPTRNAPIWDLTPDEYRQYRAECLQDHREWLLDKAFRAAVKQRDNEQILRLASKFLKIMPLVEDGEFVPPKIQPKNREETLKAWKKIRNENQSEGA